MIILKRKVQEAEYVPSKAEILQNLHEGAQEMTRTLGAVDRALMDLGGFPEFNDLKMIKTILNRLIPLANKMHTEASK